jgi:hypothetical protein
MMLLAGGDDSLVAVSPEPTIAVTIAATADEATEIPETNELSGEQPTLIVDGVETPVEWRLVEGGRPQLVRSQEQAMVVRFARGEALYLAPEAMLLLTLNSDEGEDILQVEVRNGRLVAATGAGETPPGRPILITNPFGASAHLDAGLMGIHSSLEPLRFTVDCLTGDGCHVAGDLDDMVLALAAGEAGRVGSSGRSETTGRARFEIYAPLSALVPTPTASPVPTNTPMPMATFTSTPTRVPLPTLESTDTPAAATIASLPTSLPQQVTPTIETPQITPES